MSVNTHYHRASANYGCALIVIAAMFCFTAYQIAELVVKSGQQTAATAKDSGR